MERWGAGETASCSPGLSGNQRDERGGEVGTVKKLGQRKILVIKGKRGKKPNDPDRGGSYSGSKGRGSAGKQLRGMAARRGGKVKESGKRKGNFVSRALDTGEVPIPRSS